MSETLNHGATDVLEKEDQDNSSVEPNGEPTNTSQEHISDLPGYTKEEVIAFAVELHDQLEPILMLHADTIVICERLGGAEMTLGQAMLSIWPVYDKGAMIREGLPSVMAEIQNMLANQPAQVKEEEEKDPEEEEEPKKEAEEAEQASQEADDKKDDKDGKDEQKKIEVNKPDDQAKNENDGNKQSEQSMAHAENISLSNIANTVGPEVKIAKIPAQIKPIAKSVIKTVQPNPRMGKAQDPSTVRTNSIDVARKKIDITLVPKTTAKNEKPAVEIHKAELDERAEGVEFQPLPTTESINIVSPIGPAAEQEAAVLVKEIDEAAVQPNLKIELQPELKVVPMVKDKEDEPIYELVVEEVTEQAELTEHPLDELGIEAIIEDVLELNEEIAIEAQDEASAEFVELNADVIEILDFIEDEEVVIDHSAEYFLESDELPEDSYLASLEVGEGDLVSEEIAQIYQLNGVANILQPEELPVECLDDVGVGDNAAEGVITQLAKKTEDLDPEVAEKVDEILDKILEASTDYQLDHQQKNVDKPDIPAELEELFIELLIELNIDHDPEMVESIARLFLAEQEKLKIEEPGGLPQDIGTREIINKILVSLNNTKNARLRARAIGKSVLKLAA